MALRSLLFSSDAGIAEPVCHALAELGVEAEYCAEAVPAVQKVTQTPFQIVIIDWDNQPEAGLLLQAARERKANERPLTLAIVSSDPSVPKALQAGANSILRKPLMISQVKDTLSTACALLRAKANAAAAGGGAASSSVVSPSVVSSPVVPSAAPPASSRNEKTLRKGEFLQQQGSRPGTQVETDSDVPSEQGEAPEPVDPLKDLETVAAQFSQRPPEPVGEPEPDPDGPRGLEYYLKKKGIARQAQAQAPAPKPSAAGKPELLGFDQTPSEPAQSFSAKLSGEQESSPQNAREHQAEEKLFAHIAGESEPEKEEKATRPPFRLGKGAIIGALTLAACAILATPQAPWHPQVQKLWKHGQQSLHAWLNPQPVTTAPAPAAHESFQRAGDEYKLPVVENIPDATTDPSQIQVVPVVDPTAKKPNNGAADPNLAPADGTGTSPGTPADQAGQPAGQSPAQSNVQVQENPAPQSSQPAGTNGAATGSPSGTAATPANTGSQAPATTTPAPAPSAETPRAQATTTVTPITSAPQPAASKSPPQYVAANTHVPTSLKSDMASMTPEASGNKPIEAAMPSIEPVAVSEAAERALLADQPAIAYPANARGQQGTVILQVLIGRDGAVQDAKFQQGSLAFAKAAIDGVKLWKFKPYTMNGRPVSVAATMTLIFKPGSVR